MTIPVQPVSIGVPTDRRSLLKKRLANAGGTPEGVGLAHAPNWITGVRRNFWPSMGVARLQGPMPGESSAVPMDDCVGLNSLQTSPSTGPASVRQNPQVTTARKLTSRATRDGEVQT
jgi:hypothetical protein